MTKLLFPSAPVQSCTIPLRRSSHWWTFLTFFFTFIFRRIHLDGGLAVIREDDPGRSGLKYMMNDPSGWFRPQRLPVRY